MKKFIRRVIVFAAAAGIIARFMIEAGREGFVAAGADFVVYVILVFWIWIIGMCWNWLWTDEK